MVIGAGFSRAVHSEFPVLADLPGRVASRLQPASSTAVLVEELNRSQRGYGGNLTENGDIEAGSTVDFEAWLSRIAEDQPHLSSWENLERRALYAQAAIAIRDVLLSTERRAFESRTVERWPYELMRVLDARRATVITMNYDQVIERLATQTLWVDGEDSTAPMTPRGRMVTANDLLEGLPPPGFDRLVMRYQSLPEGVVLSRLKQARTLRLLKLHGSVSWFAAPADPTGMTLAHWDPEEAGVDDEALRRRHLPGREPFLVPPSTRKSLYLENPVIREVWYRAREALTAAKSVTVVGYSLPATDTVFGGMIADTLANSDTPVTVVNPEPEPVVAQLKRLGVKGARIDPKSGEHAVKEWAQHEVDHQANLMAVELQRWASSADCKSDKPFVGVMWAPPTMPSTVFAQNYLRQVRSPAEHTGQELVLELRPETQISIDDHWPIGDLGVQIGTASRLVVEISGRRIPIIDWNHRDHVNHKQPGSVCLYPATVPADWEHLSNGQFS